MSTDDTWYGRGGWLPSRPAEVRNDTGTPESVEYTCPPCQRGHHRECRDMRCECCQGDG